MTIQSLIIDIITVLIGVFIIIDAYRKGFLRYVVLVVGCVLSFFVALYLSKIVSVHLFDAFFRENIIEYVNSTISQSVGDISIGTIVPAVFFKLPQGVQNLLYSQFGDVSQLVQLLESKTNGAVGDLGLIIADDIISPVFVGLIEVLSCFILFIIFVIIVKGIAKIFRNFYAIPIIGPVNSFLGGLLGIVQTVMIYYLIGLSISVIISFTANEMSWINQEVINSTYIIKYFVL